VRKLIQSGAGLQTLAAAHKLTNLAWDALDFHLPHCNNPDEIRQELVRDRLHVSWLEE